MKYAMVVLLLGLAVGIQVVRDRVYAQTPIDDTLLYVRSGGVMAKAALSFDAVLADVYWIRALQHYGGERQRLQQERRYDLLYPLLDLTTTLDPYFIVAYRFGAIFLAEPHPGGAGRPDLAIALLKKGVAVTPEKWDYYYDIGFVHYWNLHDYKGAAEWFSRGGELPGAPWWMKTFAAVMLTRGGDREASRFMWQQIGQSNDNWLQQTAQTRLLQLDALDEIDRLQRVADEFARRTGTRADSWERMTAARVLRRVPVDPSGTPYMLDAVTGEVRVSPSSKLYPLPTEPAAAPELAAKGAAGVAKP
jgi:tetratricopeptide (TPR) repeat protein